MQHAVCGCDADLFYDTNVVLIGLLSVLIGLISVVGLDWFDIGCLLVGPFIFGGRSLEHVRFEYRLDWLA